jgi:hypothetical protein
MSPAIVRIEEIATVWDSLGVCKTHRTLSPSGRSQASSVLQFRSNHVDSVFYFVLDTSWPRGH